MDKDLVKLYVYVLKYKWMVIPSGHSKDLGILSGVIIVSPRGLRTEYASLDIPYRSGHE